jgi:hypothetical protein
MKVPYGEGLATHTGPESCVHARKGMGEALTGGMRARLLSRERSINFGVPTLYTKAEGNIGHIVMARYGRTLRGPRPCARMQASCAGTGRSCVWSHDDGSEARAVNPKGVRQR